MRGRRIEGSREKDEVCESVRGREGGNGGRERKDKLEKVESKVEEETEDNGEDERRDKGHRVDIHDYSCSHLFFSFLFLPISIVNTVRVWRHRMARTDRTYIQIVRFSFFLSLNLRCSFPFPSRLFFIGD